jgi:hypothetical protein
VSIVGDDCARLDVAPAVLISPDGLVRATAGAAGTLARLEFAPDTFERTTPAQLADTVQTLVRQLADAPLIDGRPPQLPRPTPTPRRARRRTAPPPAAAQPQTVQPQSRRRGY